MGKTKLSDLRQSNKPPRVAHDCQEEERTARKIQPRYPLDAMQQLPDLENVDIDLALYPDKSLLGMISDGDIFDELTNRTVLTEPEHASFSWSSDETGFDMRDYLETQTVLDSLGKEERIEHFRAYFAQEQSLRNLHFEHEESQETQAVLESLGEDELMEHFQACSAQEQSLRSPHVELEEEITWADENSSACSSEDEYGIEVAQGVFQEVRGMQETYEALRMGLCAETTCLFCHITLVCVQDCDCVLCPQCQHMSPVEAKPNKLGIHLGGVGMGLFVE